MNFIKTLRKPYLSIFLASLMLFISCNPNSYETNNLDTEELKSVVMKHIQISENISSIFRNENSVNLDILSKSSGFLNNTNELKKILVEAKVENNEKLTILFSEMSNNITSFLQTINAKANYTKSEIEKIIIEEINQQLDEKRQIVVMSKASNPCYDRYFTANSRCERNWYIGVASLTISGFFTLGIGTLIGATTVGTMLLLCEHDAQSDRDKCLERK